MKRNILFFWFLYVLIVSFLLLIDISLLIYYIFWINNVFINPFIWLWIKIVYYNRTVLLLLLFYYLIAKFTIKESGYKYFYFFNIDVRKWRLLYFDYLLNMTVYHIEIISIFMFFFVILIPLFIYNKDVVFLLCFIIIFILIWLRIFKNRYKYIKEKKIRIRSFLIYPFIIIILFKIFNYQFLKDIHLMYIHLDKWAFELLEWKIQMYNKTTEKDYYSKTVGLKPKWVGEKFNKKDYIDNKIWELLYKKKKYFLKELKYKIKRTKRKYYLYTKYYERVCNVKAEQSLKKIEKLRNDLLSKDFNNIKKKRDIIYIKEYSPKINTKNENPVVTQEKERERLLHRSPVASLIHKFSLKNYYRLNTLLRDLTQKDLYYQSFIDIKTIEKYKIDEKRQSILINSKDYKFNLKEEFYLFKQIVKKFKIFKRQSLDSSINYKNYYKDNFFFNKLFDYLIVEKRKENLLNYIIKSFNEFNNDIKINKKKIKKENLTFLKFLKNTKINIEKKEKISKLYFNESKDYILKEDALIEKAKYGSSPIYLEKNELEKLDNKLLFNTVKKYNEEKTKVGWKKEFNEYFKLKEKKDPLIIQKGPDLSRRNQK